MFQIYGQIIIVRRSAIIRPLIVCLAFSAKHALRHNHLNVAAGSRNPVGTLPHPYTQRTYAKDGSIVVTGRAMCIRIVKLHHIIDIVYQKNTM